MHIARSEQNTPGSGRRGINHRIGRSKILRLDANERRDYSAGDEIAETTRISWRVSRDNLLSCGA